MPSDAARRRHLQYVAKHRCVVCSGGELIPTPDYASQAAHLGRLGMGIKNPDSYTVPLCPSCHAEQHRRGDEAAWWESVGIDPEPIRARLVAKNPEMAEELGRDPD